jgi:hypothetical protein
MIRRRPWIVPIACAAIASAFLCWFHLSDSRHDENAVAAAENEVYEALSRAMSKPANGQENAIQLVFDETVLTDFLTPAGGKNACEEGVRQQLRVDDTPPFNTLADKMYRLLTYGWYDASPRADTIQNFIVKSCTKGPLSRTFHTDVPRAFIDPNSVYFDFVPVPNNGVKDFRQAFPKAGGIISLSHVGFDSGLHEAMVATSYVCGSLCGGGELYILRKTRGKWEVIARSTLWMV